MLERYKCSLKTIKVLSKSKYLTMELKCFTKSYKFNQKKGLINEIWIVFKK